MTTSRSEEWGLCPWFEEDGTELVHPGDVEVVRALQPYGKLMQVVGRSDRYVRLRYGATEFRIQPTMFSPVPVRPRSFGEHVRLRNGETGEVVEIRWHHQRAAPMYQLVIQGKKRSKRYWESDFA